MRTIYILFAACVCVALNWNAGVFKEGKSIFIMCGINYTGELAEAKAIADYCQTLVKKAVDRRFMFSPK